LNLKCYILVSMFSFTFNLYRYTSAPPVSNTALECLVRLASVRRSLFASEVERNNYLQRLIAGTCDVLRLNQGLGEHANYHEFCRLLSRLKTNYQLSELVAVEAGREGGTLSLARTVIPLSHFMQTMICASARASFAHVLTPRGV
jgi:hypothetical protein